MPFPSPSQGLPGDLHCLPFQPSRGSQAAPAIRCSVHSLLFPEPANLTPRPSQVPWRSGTHAAHVLTLCEHGQTQGIACASSFGQSARGCTTPWSFHSCTRGSTGTCHAVPFSFRRGQGPGGTVPPSAVRRDAHPGIVHWFPSCVQGGTGTWHSVVFPITRPGPHWQPASPAIPVSRDTQDLAPQWSFHCAPRDATDTGA